MPVNPINFSQLNTKLQAAVTAVEDDFEQALEDFDPDNSDSSAMIGLQMHMQQWTIATQLQSNTLKSFGDGLKSPVQNIR